MKMLLTVFALIGATWFADASRVDDSVTCLQAQTAATAKKTITAALACVGTAGTDSGAGHTVIVKDGIYAEQLGNKIPNGSSDIARFTLQAENSRGAILCPSIGNPIVNLSNNVHFLNLDGLVLDGSCFTGSASPQDGLAFSSTDFNTIHDITVTNMEIRNVPDNGISMSGGVSIEISRNYLHDGGLERSSGGTGSAHCLYAALKDSKIFANWCDNFRGYGWHPNTFSASFPSGQDHVSENTDVFDNTFSRNGFGGKQWGTLIAGRNIRYFRNLSWGNYAAIIVGHFTTPVTDMISVHDNTLRDNAAGPYGGILLQGQSNTTIQNNTITTSGRPWDSNFEAPAVFANNICDQSIVGCALVTALPSAPMTLEVK